MNNVKCAQCGLVNWSTEVECKRCGSLLTVQGKSEPNIEIDTESKPFLSGGLKFLTAILALATLTLLLSRVFDLLDPETAAVFAVIFMLAGIALLLLTHIWLLVRIFEQSIAWGLGALFLPLVGLIAVAKFWDKTRRSFVGQLVCMGIMLVASQIMPPSLRVPSASP
jgi:hypothetical protein